MADHYPHGNLAALRVIILLAASLALFALTACNTVKGVGRDIESVGKAGERAIN